jgi:hypothetical protein
MARAKKHPKPSKPTARKVSQAMDRVRPLAGTPAMARRYDAGYRDLREKDREVGEGEPEVNG